ncbi:hypothetical protein, partial [Desulfoplanes sp.]
ENNLLNRATCKSFCSRILSGNKKIPYPRTDGKTINHPNRGMQKNSLQPPLNGLQKWIIHQLRLQNFRKGCCMDIFARMLIHLQIHVSPNCHLNVTTILLI